jgi:glycosyltransferase involved in cell wall biosynthesis
LKNKYVIGHIGRFTYAKNHEFLISLFKYIYEYDNETILLLVGDGETRKEIECQISSLGLNDSVILTGVREDIPELLQAMDVFVFPSIYEGLPVSLVEAQASGLPCLVSDRITRQVEITKAIEYIDLSSPISYWANKIAELKRNYVRKDQSRQVADAGFDIKKTSLELQQIYLDSKGTLK